MQALKRLTFLAAALALALSGLSLRGQCIGRAATTPVARRRPRVVGCLDIDGDEGVTVMEVTPTLQRTRQACAKGT